MKKQLINQKRIIVLLVMILPVVMSAQSFKSPLIRFERFTHSGTESTFSLMESPVIRYSEVVIQDSITLKPEVDYKLNYATGELTLLPQTPGSITIEYTIYPKSLTESFYYYKRVILSDSLDIRRIKQNQDRFTPSGTLIISGSKTFSISVSRDNGVDLDQSLYLKLSGEISDNINIDAQLSDSQSPISPEGNSKELSSLDDIYIKLYGKQYELSFGDLETSFTGTRFINYKSKYEGLKAVWDTGFRMGGSLAITKAKNAENIFSCSDGKQGPYYLSISDSPYNLLIIPGSETVYINGIQATRGSEYFIDYSEGTITFQKVVTSNTEIRVTFQYSNEKYNQNLYLAESIIPLGDSFKFSTYLIAKIDNKNQPIEAEFTPTDVQALKEAGDGVIRVNGVNGPFEQGTGLYILSEDESYYIYSDSLGVYNISFTYVGSEQGSYSEILPGIFQYKGANLGEWLPVKELPAPEQQVNLDLSAVYSGSFFHFKAEAMLTNNDKNTFSAQDDNDNSAWLGYGEVNLFPDWDAIQPDLLISATYQEKNRYTFADIKDATDSYDLVYIPDSDTLTVQEARVQLSFNFQDYFQPSVNIKRKQGLSLYKQDYLKVSGVLKQWKQFTPGLIYSLLRTDEKYKNYLYSKSESFRQSTSLSYHFWKIMINGNYLDYILKQTPDVVDIETGTRYNLLGGGIGSYETKKYTVDFDYHYETNDTLSTTNKWGQQKETTTVSSTQSLNLTDNHFKIFLNHSNISDKANEIEQTVDMAQFSSMNDFFNRSINFTGNYKLNNLEFFPKVRSLVYVGDNEGIYDENGEFEGDLLYDYEYINSGSPELAIEVNTDFNLFINFFSLLEKKNSFLKKLQSETALQITENSRSRDRWKIYLLNPEATFNQDTTIYGNRLFRQSFWIDLIPKRSYGVLSYENQNTLDNRYAGDYGEINKSAEKTFDSSLQYNNIFNLDWEFAYRNVLTIESRYLSEVQQNSFILETEKKLSTKLILNNRLTLTDENGSKQDSSDKYRIYSLGTKPSVTWYYQKVKLSSFVNITSNKRSGSAFLTNYSRKRAGTLSDWALQVYYKFNKYTSVNLDYTGSSYPDERTEHKLILEVKAEF